MRIFVFALLLSVTASAQPQSKEETIFVRKGKEPLVDAMKSADFAGVWTRVNESTPDLRQVDLYEFKGVKTLKMNQALCERLLGRVFGAKNSLKYSSVKIETTPRGNLCEAQVEDVDLQARVPERQVRIGFINTRAYGVVFRLTKKSDAEVLRNIQDFWKSFH